MDRRSLHQTAAQKAVSRAVTGEGSAATTLPADEPEPPAISDHISEDEEKPEEAPPATIQEPDTLIGDSRQRHQRRKKEKMKTLLTP